MPAGGVVDAHGEPAQRLVVVRWRFGLVGQWHHTLEGSGGHPVQFAVGAPRAFVVTRGDNFSVGGDADAVRGSKPGGEHFKISAALVHFDHGAVMFVQTVFESTSSTTNGTSFSKPEVALVIHLQIKSKVMERRRGVDKIAEVVVQVGLAVVVEVDQASDLVFAVHENLAVTNRQAQGLKKARGEPLPPDVFHF